MKVLLVHNRYNEPGGEDTVVNTEYDLLRSAGHDTLLFQADNGDSGAALRFALAPWNPLAARQVRDTAAQFGPALAHVHNTWFSLSPSVLRALKAVGVPIVLSLHNYRLMCVNGALFRSGQVCTLCVGRSPMPGIRYRCYRNLPSSAIAAATIGSWRASGALEIPSAFVVFTERGRTLMVEGGVPAERVHVIPHSTPDPGPRAAPPSESTDILYLGRLAAEKGILSLVERWDELGGGLRLVVAGDGPQRPAVESAARGQNVVLSGWVDRLQATRMLLQSRCLVMPSTMLESFGLVLIEAMAAGLPVITRPTVPIAETIQTTDSGWVVDDADSWRHALSQCRGGPEVDARGLAARALYEARYTPEINLRALETLFSGVADR